MDSKISHVPDYLIWHVRDYSWANSQEQSSFNIFFYSHIDRSSTYLVMSWNIKNTYEAQFWLVQIW
jgi:hypothetical protein